VTARTPGIPVPKRTDVERALDELVAYEDGLRFQELAVVLAKKRWPELIASERKRDHGLDARSDSGMGLATSITAELAKVKEDAERALKSFPELSQLIFYTSGKVTNRNLYFFTKPNPDAK
jgi:hypothetical protein